MNVFNEISPISLPSISHITNDGNETCDLYQKWQAAQEIMRHFFISPNTLHQKYSSGSLFSLLPFSGESHTHTHTHTHTYIIYYYDIKHYHKKNILLLVSVWLLYIYIIHWFSGLWLIALHYYFTELIFLEGRPRLLQILYYYLTEVKLMKANTFTQSQ